MDAMKKGWFSEINNLWPGISVSLEVTKILHEEQSKFQHVLVVDTKSHGRALMLDGIIQCTEVDEFAYQEMISFVPLACHPCPRNVLIVGGGDGGVAREVAKHPLVESITQVEIDEAVINVSKRFLPFMAVGFESPKLNLIIGDGFTFIKEHQHQFDVIITDSSDPVGPAVNLFGEKYFSMMKEALRPGGIVCSQAGTVWANLDIVKKTLEIAKNLFPAANYATVSVPTYPTGQIGFVLASLDPATNFTTPQKPLTDEDLENLNLKYYSTEVHKSAFSLPRFASTALRISSNSNGSLSQHK